LVENLADGPRFINPMVENPRPTRSRGGPPERSPLRIGTEQVDTAQVDTEQVDTEQVDTEQVDTEQVERPGC
jgi:hypothetical protein